MVDTMPMAMGPEIWVAALVAALILAVQHYFPWRMALGRDLRRTESYVMGTAGLMAPVLALLAMWGAWVALAAVVAVCAAGGLAVLGCQALDGALEARRRAIEAEEREKTLREGAE